MCRKPEVRWACVHSCNGRTTYSDPRRRRGGCSRHGKNAAKRGLLALIRAEADSADCVGGSRVRRGLVAEFSRKTRHRDSGSGGEVDDEHAPQQSTARKTKGLGIWNCAEDLGRRQGSGHCRGRDVREYRCTCGGRAVQGLRMSLLVFAMTQNGRRIEWAKGGTRADTRPHANKQRSGGSSVGAMGTRLWEDRGTANHRLDRFVLASTCIHLIRKGWKEPRSIVEEAWTTTPLEAGAMLKRRL